MPPGQQVDREPGSLFWLIKLENIPVNDLSAEEESELNGKWGHPILILGPAKKRRTETPVDKFYVLMTTSFTNRGSTVTLSERFPHNLDVRAKHLPLEREGHPPVPHPDNGILLKIHTTGSPSFLKKKQSYLKIEPFTIRREWITEVYGARRGVRVTAVLTDEAFKTVQEQVERFHPSHSVVLLWKPNVRHSRPTPTPSRARRQEGEPSRNHNVNDNVRTAQPGRSVPRATVNPSTDPPPRAPNVRTPIRTAVNPSAYPPPRAPDVGTPIRTTVNPSTYPPPRAPNVRTPIRTTPPEPVSYDTYRRGPDMEDGQALGSRARRQEESINAPPPNSKRSFCNDIFMLILFFGCFYVLYM